VGNEENEYPVPGFNKTMINIIKGLRNALKETLKKKISEKSMEKKIDMAKLNVQDALKKFQNTKNKEHEMTHKHKGTQRGPQ
jgi:hypothetical protein